MPSCGQHYRQGIGDLALFPHSSHEHRAYGLSTLFSDKGSPPRRGLKPCEFTTAEVIFITSDTETKQSNQHLRSVQFSSSMLLGFLTHLLMRQTCMICWESQWQSVAKWLVGLVISGSWLDMSYLWDRNINHAPANQWRMDILLDSHLTSNFSGRLFSHASKPYVKLYLTNQRNRHSPCPILNITSVKVSTATSKIKLFVYNSHHNL